MMPSNDPLAPSPFIHESSASEKGRCKPTMFRLLLDRVASNLTIQAVSYEILLEELKRGRVLAREEALEEAAGSVRRDLDLVLDHLSRLGSRPSFAPARFERVAVVKMGPGGTAELAYLMNTNRKLFTMLRSGLAMCESTGASGFRSVLMELLCRADNRVQELAFVHAASPTLAPAPSVIHTPAPAALSA